MYSEVQPNCGVGQCIKLADAPSRANRKYVLVAHQEATLNAVEMTRPVDKGDQLLLGSEDRRGVPSSQQVRCLRRRHIQVQRLYEHSRLGFDPSSVAVIAV